MAVVTDDEIEEKTESGSEPVKKVELDFESAGLGKDKLTVDMGGGLKEESKTEEGVDVDDGQGLRVKASRGQKAEELSEDGSIKKELSDGQSFEADLNSRRVGVRFNQERLKPRPSGINRVAGAPELDRVARQRPLSKEGGSSQSPEKTVEVEQTEVRPQSDQLAPEVYEAPEVYQNYQPASEPEPSEESLKPNSRLRQEVRGRQVRKLGSDNTLRANRLRSPELNSPAESRQGLRYGSQNYSQRPSLGRSRLQPLNQTKAALKSELSDAAKSLARDKAKKAVGKVTRQGVKAAARVAASATASIVSFLVATAEIWVPVLAVVLLVGFVVVVTVPTLCRVPGVSLVGLGDLCDSMGVEETAVVAGVSDVVGGSPTEPREMIDGSYNHNVAELMLREAGIPVTSSNNCSDKNNSKCTSLDGVKIESVREVILFKQECDKWASQNGLRSCSVIVTGGTEVGHAGGSCSHGGGYKIDLGYTDSVTRFIKTNFREGQARGRDRKFIASWRSAAYYEELAIPGKRASHWDIAVNCEGVAEV